ncbi:hypothetical protein HanIR_Chr12g0600791 [Helianthus annuus]|nr:hypothetical protein HanIR_Chr12g0600791 [Helianthus annuus]
MIRTKIEKQDERISKLNMHEIEDKERRKQKSLRFQRLIIVKIRMQAEIAGLLEKTKHHWV